MITRSLLLKFKFTVSTYVSVVVLRLAGIHQEDLIRGITDVSLIALLFLSALVPLQNLCHWSHRFREAADLGRQA